MRCPNGRGGINVWKLFHRQGHRPHHPDPKRQARHPNGNDHCPQARPHANDQHHGQDRANPVDGLHRPVAGVPSQLCGDPPCHDVDLEGQRVDQTA